MSSDLQRACVTPGVHVKWITLRGRGYRRCGFTPRVPRVAPGPSSTDPVRHSVHRTVKFKLGKAHSSSLSLKPGVGFVVRGKQKYALLGLTPRGVSTRAKYLQSLRDAEKSYVGSGFIVGLSSACCARILPGSLNL